MDLEAFVYQSVTTAGHKISESEVLNHTGPYTLYTLINWDRNYLGSSVIKTGIEYGEFAFNSYAKTKTLARNEIIAIASILEDLAESYPGEFVSTVYSISSLPRTDRLFGYTMMADIEFNDKN